MWDFSLWIPKSQTHAQQKTEKLSQAGWEGGTLKTKGGGGWGVRKKGITESALLEDRKGALVLTAIGRSVSKHFCQKTERGEGPRNREGVSHVQGEKRSCCDCLGNKSLW